MAEMSNEMLFALRDLWYSEAEKQTVETLPAFIKMLNEYSHNYDNVIYATNAAALAASWVMSKYHGITGFQSSAVMWEYIQNWGCGCKNKPLCLINYEEMLYPMFDYKFTTIDKRTWDWIRKQARENLCEITYADESVKARWQSIIDGKVPFGYTVRD